MKYQRLCLFPLLLILLIGCSGGDDSADSGMGKVRGRVLAPLEASHLYIYRKGMDLYGPAYALSEATDADGKFDLALPTGDYVGVVRKRGGGETSGPVLAGDNKSDFIDIHVGAEGVELSVVAPVKVGDARRLTVEEARTETGLAGRILDSDGNPVMGARVHVYDHVQMSERPKFVSKKTGPDGRYLIYLPDGGTFYVAARDKFGGPPKLGDLYGRYDQGTIEPSAVVVRAGEVLQAVEITVTKVW